MKIALILLAILLQACVSQPEGKGSKSKGSSFFTGDSIFNDGNNNSSGSTNNNNGTAPTFQHELKWYASNSYLSSLNLYPNSSSVTYIRGSKIHEFLNTSGNNKIYCMLMQFNDPDSTILSIRLNPQTINDFSKGTTEKAFKLSFSDHLGNQSNCSMSSSSVVYRLSDVCPSCSNYLTGSIQGLYNSLKQDPNDNMSWSLGSIVSNPPALSTTLQFQLNYNNTGSSNQGSGSGSAGGCTNSSCQAQNFDCCIESQCVNNASVRSSAAANNPDLFDQVQALVSNNPALYSYYPEFYYICPSNTGNTNGNSGGSTTGTSNGNGTNPAQDALNALIADYNCVEEMKLYSNADPFHIEPINEDESYEYCSIDEEEDLYYEKVLMRLYDRCGCESAPLNDRIQNCPAYTYQVVSSDNNGTPTDIICKTPEVVVDTPFQNLNIVLNSRTAPHRFFKLSDGEAVDDFTTLGTQSEETAEGQEFLYQDSEKIQPLNGSFNMNSVMGQFSLTLDQALPAKVINVEYDDTYFISTLSGFYTPCPSCAKDSWYPSFSAWPSTSAGVGMRGISHTTSRDSYGHNTSQGNYEDNIFGRACFVPPTMLPHSYVEGSDPSEQRQLRLQNQAAMYMNGYQRDWYGFNKGAVIGSFDGVTWFAIGKGRIVRASSNKLFIAINAPFADLASPTNHTISIQTYEGMSSGAIYDYDPNFAPDYALQNEAASCQNYHTCETDKDCISQLGWEYACADVKDIKTQWPSFDTTANEIVGEAQTLLIEQILQQGRLPSGSSKRCVYRGAGAPCAKNAEEASSANIRKLLTCAPNFYCASADETVFNTEVARYNGALENLPLNANHLFGQDANVLGRPMHYISNNLSELPDSAAQAISDSVLTYFADADTTGLCRPGKATASESTNPIELARTPDSELRTDYISQIGSLDSSSTDASKFISCPVLNDSGDYIMFLDGYLEDLNNDPSATEAQYTHYAQKQNAGGNESLNSEGNSPFKRIEGSDLSDEEFIALEPTLVKNACFRRAGSVCHTDLDCSPNKMHSEEATNFTLDYFGNIAEKQYWEENLVCGQAMKAPSPFDSNFSKYKLYENRCCREIGKDITIYSEKTPNVTESQDISTTTFGYASPDAPERYSRFSIADDLGDGVSGSNEVDSGELADIVNLLTKNQWKPISQVAQKTCCGGGWVRKFADGTTNWSNTSRLALDVTNFKCLNYKSPLVNATNPQVDFGVKQSWLSRDYNRFCMGDGSQPGAPGCAETGMSIDGEGFEIVPPTLDSTGSIKVRTGQKFMATPFSPFAPNTNDGKINYFDHSNAPASGNRVRGYDITLVIPAYMPPAEINSVTVKKVNNDTNSLNGGSCQIVIDASCKNFDDIASENCEACINTTLGSMKVTTNGLPGEDHYIEIDFTAPGTNAFDPASRSALGGNYLYYLRKLGRLELIGIPQIYYEPISCNDNYKSIVPGILKDTVQNVDQFNADEHTFNASSVAEMVSLNDPTNPLRKATSSAGLQHDKIFSDHEFKCCLELGSATADASQCCSGYAKSAGGSNNNPVLNCALPTGANLNVYFNRFVTSEGSKEDSPGGGLTDDDFNAQTGEPILNEAVYNKLVALGQAYCETNGTRRGGAFGQFDPEPSAGGQSTSTSTTVTIVDSYVDNGSSLSSSGSGGQADSGYQSFSQGFRWNHHVYCSE